MTDETTNDAAVTQPIAEPEPASADAAPVAPDVPPAPVTAPYAPPAPVAPPAEKNRTSLYVFAAVAAVVLALGLSAVSFGAGVFVGRASGGRADFARTTPGVQGTQQWGQGRQGVMPPSSGNGWSRDGQYDQDDSDSIQRDGRGNGRGHGGFGSGAMPPGYQNAPTTPDNSQ